MEVAGNLNNGNHTHTTALHHNAEDNSPRQMSHTYTANWLEASCILQLPNQI